MTAVVAALDTVLGIFDTQNFADVLQEQELIKKAKEKPSKVGEEVLHALRNELPAQVALATKNYWWSTTAETDISKGLITIDEDRIDTWHNGRPDLLINTVAHELTHLVPTQKKNESRYTDDDRADCEETVLVSYRVGDLAQCLFLDSTEPKLSQCINTLVNARSGRAEQLKACEERWPAP